MALATALAELDSLPAIIESIRAKYNELVEKESGVIDLIEQLYLTAVQSKEAEIMDIERQMEEGILEPKVIENESCELLRIIEKSFPPTFPSSFSDIVSSLKSDKEIMEIIKIANFFFPERTSINYENWLERSIVSERKELIEFILKSNYAPLNIGKILSNYLTRGSSLYDLCRCILSDIVELLFWYVDNHPESCGPKLFRRILFGVWESEDEIISTAFFQSKYFKKYHDINFLKTFALVYKLPALDKVLNLLINEPH